MSSESQLLEYGLMNDTHIVHDSTAMHGGWPCLLGGHAQSRRAGNRDGIASMFSLPFLGDDSAYVATTSRSESKLGE